MASTFSRGDRIEICGFGSFKVNHRPARTGRSPATGEVVEAATKRSVHFKPGKELRNRVDL